MTNLTLSNEQTYALQGELAQFVQIAVALDPQFEAPSLEDFALAKLSGNTDLLTRESIRKAIARASKALVQETGEDRTFATLEGLLRIARLYGFAFVRANDEDMDTASATVHFAKRIVSELNLEERHVSAIVNVLTGGAVPIDTAVRVHFKCREYQLVSSLYERADKVYRDIVNDHEVGMAEVLKWKIMAGLAEEYGSLSSKEVDHRFAFIRDMRPELFEPDDWIDKLAASLKKACGRKSRTKEPLDVSAV